MVQVQQQFPSPAPAPVADNLMGEAMIYIFLLSFSAGIGLLFAALVGYIAWGKWQARGERKTARIKRKGA